MKDHRAFYEEVGRRIREARTRRKPALTQERLGELVSLTRTSITNLEKGRQKIPLHTLAEIAEALQVGVVDLLPDDRAKDGDRLDAELEGLPPSESVWIKSAVWASEKLRNTRGS